MRNLDHSPSRHESSARRTTPASRRYPLALGKCTLKHHSHGMKRRSEARERGQNCVLGGGDVQSQRPVRSTKSKSSGVLTPREQRHQPITNANTTPATSGPPTTHPYLPSPLGAGSPAQLLTQTNTEAPLQRVAAHGPLLTAAARAHPHPCSPASAPPQQQQHHARLLVLASLLGRQRRPARRAVNGRPPPPPPPPPAHPPPKRNALGEPHRTTAIGTNGRNRKSSATRNLDRLCR